MLQVISFTICPFVQRLTALLEAKQIPYQVKYISLKDKPDWFLELSPHGQVPVLVTEKGTALFESEAIVEYIAEVYPNESEALSAEERAKERAWGYLAAKHYLTQCSAQRSGDYDTLISRQAKLNKAFSAIERAKGDLPFFNSEEPGWVDVAWLPLLHRAGIIEQYSGYDFLKEFPKLRQWQQNLIASGLTDRSVADNFEDKFTEFYLSKDTYLGNGCCDSSANGKLDTHCATGNCC